MKNKNTVVFDIKTESTESIVIRRLAKQIGGVLNLNRNKEICKANNLCMYWVAVDKQEKATKLLDLICFNVEYNGNESLWAMYGQSLLLRAHIAEQGGDSDIVSRVTSILDDEDISAISRVKGFVDGRADHREALSVAEIETQKYQCEIYAQEIYFYLYDKFMLPLERPDFAESVENEYLDGIELNMKYLREALVSRRKADVHRLPMHRYSED